MPLQMYRSFSGRIALREATVHDIATVLGILVKFGATPSQEWLEGIAVSSSMMVSHQAPVSHQPPVTHQPPMTPAIGDASIASNDSSAINESFMHTAVAKGWKVNYHVQATVVN